VEDQIAHPNRFEKLNRLTRIPGHEGFATAMAVYVALLLMHVHAPIWYLGILVALGLCWMIHEATSTRKSLLERAHMVFNLAVVVPGGLAAGVLIYLRGKG
jgi:4-hydroxybenzoate polyprenyltransferase